MKKSVPFIVIAVLCVMFPFVAGLSAPAIISDSEIPTPDTNTTNTTPILCLDHKSGKVGEINLEEYLVGVLAAEMPAEYHPEALKAQAVAARSYILNKTETTNEKHPEAAVCTDSKHCKDWLSEKDAKARWPAKDQKRNWEKLKSAVTSTKGEYIIYDGQVIEACFFASSGGRTENSEDVWGGSRPYLKSVDSSEDTKNPSSKSTVTVPYAQFAKALNINTSSVTPTGFETISRTEGGSVANVTLCGKTFSGTQIRQIFGLKSANFTITTDNDNIIFNVLGYGHGVGMSQLGANEMAKNGKNYTEILSHYYTNIQIAKM